VSPPGYSSGKDQHQHLSSPTPIFSSQLVDRKLSKSTCWGREVLMDAMRPSLRFVRMKIKRMAKRQLLCDELCIVTVPPFQRKPDTEAIIAMPICLGSGAQHSQSIHNSCPQRRNVDPQGCSVAVCSKSGLVEHEIIIMVRGARILRVNVQHTWGMAG